MQLSHDHDYSMLSAAAIPAVILFYLFKFLLLQQLFKFLTFIFSIKLCKRRAGCVRDR